jgi:serralysin
MSSVKIDGTQATVSGSAGNIAFIVSAGTFTATITGFRATDTISFPDNSLMSVSNTSYSDGLVTLSYAAAGQVANIILSELTTVQDGSINFAGDLNAVFGAGTLVLASTQPGTSGSDIFRITSGSNNIDGGAGSDIVQYQTTRSAASVTVNNGTITVSKAGGTDTITGVERIDFTDGDLIFDVASSFAPAAYRLYGGAFDRTPDEGGFRFWTSKLDEKSSLHNVAAEFINSGEFIARYGASLSNAAFVDALYQNVLHRGGDTGGIAYWNQQLDTKAQDRPNVLVQFTQLPEFVGISAANITNGYWVS